MKVKIRKNIKALKASATLEINEKSKALIKDGRTIYRLGFGQSPFPVPESIVAALRENAYQKDYLPVKGLTELRKAIADYNRSRIGIDCTYEDIMIGPGSKELMLTLQMISDATLVLPNPSWVSYGPQAQIASNKVVWANTDSSTKWLITAEQLEKVAIENMESPLILLLNYPSNPVGSSYDEDTLINLAQVAKRHQILVISDEIYGELNFKGEYNSIAKYYPEGTIISSGLSKWCGAGGWRLGTFTFPSNYRYLMDSLAVVASESFSAVSAPIQYAAVRAFEFSEDLEKYLIQSREILSFVGNYVHHQLLLNKVKTVRPEGGFYLFPDFGEYSQEFQRKGIQSSIDLCNVLLEEVGIALLPGEAFGRPIEEFTCRLSYVDFDGNVCMKALDNGEKLTAAFLEKNCSKMAKSMTMLSNWLSNLK